MSATIRALSALAIGAFVVLPIITPAPAEAPGGGIADSPIDWRTNLKEAEEEAKRAGKPMLVVFRCEP